MYDSSFKTIAGNIGLAAGSVAASGGHLAFVRENGKEAEVVIPADSIAHAAEAKKGMIKRVVITLTDGEQYTFEYGLLGVERLVAAVNEVASAA